MATPEQHDPLDPVRAAIDGLDEWHALEAAKLAAQKIPDSQLLDFRMWIADEEPKRREKARVVEQAQADLIGELVAAGTLTGPATATVEEVTETQEAPAWQNPGVDHAKMYLHGAVVEHAGKLWQSIQYGLNHWEPGTENGLTWAEVYLPESDPAEGEEPAGETVPEFKQPTGAHDSYPLGAKVTFDGNVFESLIANNAYSPSAYPAGWQKL